MKCDEVPKKNVVLRDDILSSFQFRCNTSMCKVRFDSKRTDFGGFTMGIPAIRANHASHCVRSSTLSRRRQKAALSAIKRAAPYPVDPVPSTFGSPLTIQEHLEISPTYVCISVQGLTLYLTQGNGAIHTRSSIYY